MEVTLNAMMGLEEELDFTERCDFEELVSAIDGVIEGSQVMDPLKIRERGLEVKPRWSTDSELVRSKIERKYAEHGWSIYYDNGKVIAKKWGYY